MEQIGSPSAHRSIPLPANGVIATDKTPYTAEVLAQLQAARRILNRPIAETGAAALYQVLDRAACAFTMQQVKSYVTKCRADAAFASRG